MPHDMADLRRRDTVPMRWAWSLKSVLSHHFRDLACLRDLLRPADVPNILPTVPSIRASRSMTMSTVHNTFTNINCRHLLHNATVVSQWLHSLRPTMIMLTAHDAVCISDRNLT